MSVINQMLRDLEKQSQQKNKNSVNNEVPVTVVKSNLLKGIIFGVAGVLLIAVIVWMVVQFVPSQIATPAVNNLPVVLPTVSAPLPAAVDAKVSSMAAAPTLEQAHGLDNTTDLLTLNVFENKHNATLHLFFAKLPEYQLLPNGTGAAQLAVSFKDTRPAANFEIPIVAGQVVKRISLVPQKGTLTLLVDIAKQAQITSFQLLETASTQYQLTIDVELTKLPVATPLIVKPVVAVSSPQVAAAPQKQLPAPSVAKNVTAVNPDKQAYELGLKQFKRVDYIAAQKSFSHALELNPSLLAARLYLVQLFQKQNQVEQAQQLLQQGLVLHPANNKLRKELARLHLQQQQHLVAIELLTTKPLPAVAQDLEYFALLAVLQQEAGQFEAAAATYEYLLQVRSNDPLWWFGLALAHDQGGNYEQARQAYQQAVILPHLEAKLRDYCNNRLQQL